MKKKKHEQIIKDYEKSKQKHLESLATKILKNDERTSYLKSKYINDNFLNLF